MVQVLPPCWYDRVLSRTTLKFSFLFSQDGADKEKRPAIMRETIHNLALSATTGSLWLIDNESAFLVIFLIDQKHIFEHLQVLMYLIYKLHEYLPSEKTEDNFIDHLEIFFFTLFKKIFTEH
jgi:hypothetical protein